jgi:PDDEXK-like domain of unknown function (DUF3799)
MMQVSENTVIQNILSQLLSGQSHLSYSSLSSFKSSPKDFIDYKMGRKEQTDAMIYGAMVHCLVLEPEDFDNRYHCLDDADICNQIGGAKPRATKAYKEWKAVAEQEANGRILVETDDYTHAKIVAANVLNNDASRKVLSKCPKRELPVEWDYMNFKFKGFIDGIGDNAIFDLKTCPDANPKKFTREIYDRGYYLQAAMYIFSQPEPKPYYIIAVDRKGGVSVHGLDERLIDSGMKEYSELLTRFNECILTDHFNKSYDFWSNRHDGIFMTPKPSFIS